MENQRATSSLETSGHRGSPIDQIFSKALPYNYQDVRNPPPLTSYRPNVNSILDAICQPKSCELLSSIKVNTTKRDTKSIYNGRHYGREHYKGQQQNHHPIPFSTELREARVLSHEQVEYSPHVRLPSFDGDIGNGSDAPDGEDAYTTPSRRARASPPFEKLLDEKRSQAVDGPVMGASSSKSRRSVTVPSGSEWWSICSLRNQL